MATAQEQANRFEERLIASDFKYDTIDSIERPAFVLGFGGGDFTFSHVRLHIIFDDDGGSAQIVTSPIVSVPKDKTAQILLACNKSNLQYRWAKFYIDDDNDLTAEADVILNENTTGEECVEVVMRTVSILDDTYSDFMRAIWA